MGVSGIGGISPYDTAYQPGSKTKAAEEAFSQEEMMQMISQKIEEIQTKLEHGDTEESFAIGGSDYTLDEWESLIDKFDAVQETVREEQQERVEKLKAEQVQEIYENKEMDDAVADSLVSESMIVVHPVGGEDMPDEQFITWYNEEGIYCREVGQTAGYFFRMSFDDVSQYETVKDFMSRVPENVNQSFIANKEFWTELLEGNVNEEGFFDFLAETKDGIWWDDVIVDKNGGSMLDREKATYAMYQNPYRSDMYSGNIELEEFNADYLLREGANQKSIYQERLEEVLNNMSDDIKSAWEYAEEVAGVDGFGMKADGTLSYISEFMKDWIIKELNGDYTSNLLGNTVDSALDYAKQALDSLENPVIRERNMTYARFKEKEEMFYHAFIEKLESL